MSFWEYNLVRTLIYKKIQEEVFKMTKEVFGVYETEEEVIAAVETFKSQGYKPEEISLIANDNEDKSWLRKQTGVETNNEDTNNDESFLDKLKAAFTGDGNNNNTTNYVNQFNEAGLSEVESRQFDADVRSGKIVVLGPKKVTETDGITESEITDHGNDLSEGDSARKVETKSKKPLAERTSPLGGTLVPEDEDIAHEDDKKEESGIRDYRQN